MTIRFASIVFLLLTTWDCLSQSLNVVPSASSCNCNGSVTISNAGVGPYSLFDSNGAVVQSGISANGVITINNLCPLVYSLQFVGSNGASAIEYFNVPTALFAPGTADNISVCSTDGSVNLNNQITGIVNGGSWLSPSGSLISSQPIPASSMTEGWYTYEFISGGCSVITGVYVHYIQNANAGLTTTYEICESYQPFVMLDFMQGNPDPGGQWYDPSGNTFNGIYDPSTMSSGLYTYLIDNVPGCSPIFRTMNVDENVQPNAGEDNFIWVCEGASPFSMLGQLNGNPELGGQWYGPGNVPVGNSFNPSTMPAGNYRYIMTAEAPCVTDIAILTIQYYPQPAAGTDNNLALCETANPVNLFNALNGNPQTGGVWISPSGSATDQLFDPITDPAGTYTYQFNQVGCIGESSTITIQVEQTHAAGPDEALHVCYDSGTIPLNALLPAAADANGTWLNSSGIAIGNLFDIPETIAPIDLTYFVAGTLCPSDQAVYTIIIDSLTTDPPNQSITLCSLDSPFNLSTLYPGCPNVAFYTPSGTAISPLLNPSQFNGTAILVEMPSTNTCPDGVGQISVTIETPFWITDTAYVSVCQTAATFDLNSTLPAALQSGGAWYTSSNVMTGNIINLLGPSTMWFRYSLNTAPSCGDSDFYLSITIDAPVDAGPNGSVQFCYTDDAVDLNILMPNTVGTNGAWTFNGAAYTSNVIHPGTQPPGNYLYTLPANGSCPADDATLQVFIEYGINYSAGGDIGACAGSPEAQIGLINSPNLSYSWSPALNLSSTSIAQPNVSFFTSNTQDEEVTYVVTVTDGICTVSDTVEVITYAPPQVDLGEDREICAGQTITFSLNVPGTYTWEPAAYFSGNAATQNITPLTDFTAYLEVANAQGCIHSDSAGIIVHPLPVVDYTPDFVSSCSPYEWHAELGDQSQNANEVVWFIPGIGAYYGSAVDILIQEAGLYDVQVTATSDFGCSSQRYFEDVLQVLSNPMASFKYHPSELTTLEYVAQFTDLSIGALNYLWTFDEYGMSTDPEPSFAFPHEDPASFQVCLRVENEFGCADSTCRTITLDNEYILFAPNAFTPDGDGINDTFLPVLRGFDLSTYELQIYNRWGELIFETHDTEEPWVGDVKGGAYFGEDNVYNWLIRVKDKEISDFQLFRGSVILLR